MGAEMPGKSTIFADLSAESLSIRYVEVMRLKKIALIATTALLGITLLSSCGGSGDEGAQSGQESGSESGGVAVGTQQLLINQQLTVLDQQFAYPKKGASQVSSAITTLEPGQETGWQQHRIPVFVHVMSGTYTVEYEAGVTKEFPAGSSFMQAVRTNYNGINKSEDSVQLLSVYMGAKGKRIVVPQR
jgi:quercetin dioxygenase-like cupin family protein